MGFMPEIPQGCPFTIGNIPFGVISTTETPEPHCATAIGDYALDLAAYFQQEDLNALYGLDLVNIFSKVGQLCRARLIYV